MGNDGFEEVLNQYGRLTRKLSDAETELDKVHESLHVEGVYACTSSNKQTWSEAHDKIAKLADINAELNEILDYILGIRETYKLG